MEFFTQILLVTVFQNAVFTRALGASALPQISRGKKNLLGFFVSVTYIMTVTGFICFFVDYLWGNGELSRIFLPPIYVFILGLVYIATLLCLWRFLYGVFKKIKKYLHISAFNGAVLGSILLNSTYGVTLFDYVTTSIGVGCGFALSVYFVSTVYDKLYSEDAPYLFRGYPLLLIYVGILGMAFFGFTGYQIRV
jgi:electron transport complex protein RnfA